MIVLTVIILMPKLPKKQILCLYITFNNDIFYMGCFFKASNISTVTTTFIFI